MTDNASRSVSDCVSGKSKSECKHRQPSLCHVPIVGVHCCVLTITLCHKLTPVEQTLRQTQLEVSACQRPGRFACQLSQCLIQRRQVADASESRDFSVSNAGRPGSCPGRVTPLCVTPLPCTCSRHSAHRLYLNYGRKPLGFREAGFCSTNYNCC